VWYAEVTAPLGTQRVVLGIFANPSDPALAPGIKSYPIRKTWAATVGEFATSYAAKSAIWLLKLPL